MDSQDAQSLLPKFLDKCHVPEHRASALKTVHSLAKLAWNSKQLLTGGDRDFYYGYTKVEGDIVWKTMTDLLLLHQYQLFNDILGWLKTLVDPRIFSTIRLAQSQGQIEFSAIQTRLVLHPLSRHVLCL